jgi:hypothetical protein
MASFSQSTEVSFQTSEMAAERLDLDGLHDAL